ncbi:MAG: alginate export family protein [Phycisphaerae bacterium]
MRGTRSRARTIGTTAAAWLLVLGCPLGARAQGESARRTESNTAQVEETAATSREAEPAADAPSLRGPKYLNLRYDEDFSYLDGPKDSYKPDLFDPLKNIHPAKDLTLSVGGVFRARLEAETNKGFGSTEPAQDTFFLHQYRLHTDLRYRRLFRFYFEGINAMIEDRDLRLLGIHENRWDIHQLFFDVRPLGEKVPLTIRVGRQELSYGNQRLISPLAWANTRRRFDAAKLFYHDDKFDIDFFYARPLPISIAEGLHRRPDVYREEAHFYGVYSAIKTIPHHVLDLYFLGLNDNGNRVNANGRAGDESRYTIGGRLAGKIAPIDYEGELAGQWGKFAGDTVHAWMAAADGGYTFKNVPWSPRIGVGFDYASGDDDPTDGTHDTFNQLFPFSHFYLGYIDAVARQNILASNVNLTFKPFKKLTTRLAWYTFWNDAKRDALYNAGGAPTRRDLLGNSGHDIGNELDLLIKYKIDVHQNVLFGYSHFWGVNFIRSTGPSRDADFLYLQYQFTF